VPWAQHGAQQGASRAPRWNLLCSYGQAVQQTTDAMRWGYSHQTLQFGQAPGAGVASVTAGPSLPAATRRCRQLPPAAA
jgi:hypothetical protein